MVGPITRNWFRAESPWPLRGKFRPVWDIDKDERHADGCKRSSRFVTVFSVILMIRTGNRHPLLLYAGQNFKLFPLHYSISRWRRVCHLFDCSFIGFSSPIRCCRSALLNAGHKISRSHACPGSLKTTASRRVIHDIFRSWIKLNPVKIENISENSPARRLLSQEPELVL